MVWKFAQVETSRVTVLERDIHLGSACEQRRAPLTRDGHGN